MNSWLLLSLLMAHVIGDFYLQSDKYCKRKEESKLKSPFLYVHSTIIGLLSWAFVQTVDFWVYALLISVTHLMIDSVKSYMCKGLWPFLVDQIAHIVILCFIAHQYVPLCHLPIQGIDFLDHISIPTFVFAILCCLKPTNILIKLILERYKIGENFIEFWYSHIIRLNGKTIIISILILHNERINRYPLAELVRKEKSSRYSTTLSASMLSVVVNP